MTEENAKIPEENVLLEDMGIGEDVPQIAPKRVVIETFAIEDVKKDDKLIGQKLVLNCKHPDVTDRSIDISSVKYAQKDKIKQSGLWVKKDKDGKLPYNSAVANLLRKLGKPTIKSLKGEQIDTVTDEGGYLCVKAY